MVGAITLQHSLVAVLKNVLLRRNAYHCCFANTGMALFWMIFSKRSISTMYKILFVPPLSITINEMRVRFANVRYIIHCQNKNVVYLLVSVLLYHVVHVLPLFYLKASWFSLESVIKTGFVIRLIRRSQYGVFPECENVISCMLLGPFASFLFKPELLYLFKKKIIK